MEEVQFLKSENERLRQVIGSWRRKAQAKASRRELFKEGFKLYGSEHYKVYVLTDIPGDLPMKQVLKEIELEFLPEVYPYLFSRCDYSTKFDGWLVEVSAGLGVQGLHLECSRGECCYIEDKKLYEENVI